MADKLKYVKVPGKATPLQIEDVEAVRDCVFTVDDNKIMNPLKGFILKTKASDGSYYSLLDTKTTTIVTPTVTTDVTDNHVTIVESMSVDDTTHTLSFGTKMYKTGDCYTVDYQM